MLERNPLLKSCVIGTIANNARLPVINTFELARNKSPRSLLAAGDTYSLFSPPKNELLPC